MDISSFYRLLHLFNTFLQIGKTFFTGEPYYIHKFSEATKKIHQGKFVEFYNILDETQKAQVIERLRYRMG